MLHEALKRMPHTGAMRLIEHVVSADANEILCIAHDDRAATYPLRLDGELHPCTLVELGAQAAAAHTSLFGVSEAHTGLILALSNVVILRDRIAGDAPLTVRAELRQSHEDAARYRFEVIDAAGMVVTGDVLLSMQRRTQ